MDYISNMLLSVLKKTADFQYDHIYCDLTMYEEAVDINSFAAISKDIIIIANGKADKYGKISLYLKALFSPEFSSNLPEESELFLEEASGGWLSFSIKIMTDAKNPFLKLETDRLRLSITEIKP